MSRRAIAWSAVAIALTLGIPARAKGSETAPGATWRVGPYLGGAMNSPAGKSWGEIPDRNHVFVGLRGVTSVLRVGRVGLAYSPEIVPILVVTNNPTYRTITQEQDGDLVQVRIVDGRGPVMGLGFVPFGLETDFRVSERWSLYGACATGCVWFTRETPVLGSRSFNFTFEIGGGLLWQYQPRRWVVAGYKFHHLSNAYTADQNPGLDGNVFYAGWQRSFRVPS